MNPEIENFTRWDRLPKHDSRKKRSASPRKLPLVEHPGRLGNLVVRGEALMSPAAVSKMPFCWLNWCTLCLMRNQIGDIIQQRAPSALPLLVPPA